MLTSSKAYEIIRESGLIYLPSKRTLHDYTHWHNIKPGFDATIINHLRKEAKVDSLADWQRYIYYTYNIICHFNTSDQRKPLGLSIYI